MTQKAKKSNAVSDIEISTPHLIWKVLDFDAEMVAYDCINAALSYIELPANLENTPFEVSIVLASDPMIQTLNSQYRDIDSPTNVLSFPAYNLSGYPEQTDGGQLLGDIILSYETIVREAEEQKKYFKDHLSHLVIHGFLHLLGHDHEEDEDAKAMEELEIKILSAIGLKNPYE